MIIVSYWLLNRGRFVEKPLGFIAAAVVYGVGYYGMRATIEPAA